MFQDFKDRWDESRVRKNCKQGKHRWGRVTEKTEDGQKLEYEICQSCGEEKDDGEI